jgi:hypothetical protein
MNLLCALKPDSQGGDLQRFFGMMCLPAFIVLLQLELAQLES